MIRKPRRSCRPVHRSPRAASDQRGRQPGRKRVQRLGRPGSRAGTPSCSSKHGSQNLARQFRGGLGRQDDIAENDPDATHDQAESVCASSHA